MNCDKCEKNHICCKDYGVTLSKEEAERIEYKKIVPLTENGLILGYVFAIKKKDGSCVYLKNNRCEIYDKRPNACRRFNCDDRI